MDNIVKTEILVENLTVGMTVEYRGEMLTVGKNDVSNGFMGYAFRGDASSKTITRIQFKVPTNKGFSLR